MKAQLTTALWFKLSLLLFGIFNINPVQALVLESGQSIFSSVKQSAHMTYEHLPLVNGRLSVSLRNVDIRSTDVKNLYLYVKQGSGATPSNYDCKLENSDKRKTCTINVTSSKGNVFIKVYGHRSGKYVVSVGLQPIPQTNPPIISLNDRPFRGDNKFAKVRSSLRNGPIYYSLPSRQGAKSATLSLLEKSRGVKMFIKKSNKIETFNIKDSDCDVGDTPGNLFDSCTIPLVPNKTTYINIAITTTYENSTFRLRGSLDGGRNKGSGFSTHNYRKTVVNGNAYSWNMKDMVYDDHIPWKKTPRAGVSFRGMVAKGSWVFYRIRGVRGYPKLSALVSTSSTDGKHFGDVDIYIKKGAEPTKLNYDCKAAGSSLGDNCKINLHHNEFAYVGFYGATNSRYYWLLEASQ
ncbi:hypothetical protein [Pseudoalteromonas marina]|uniref:hypothetical protein n=1 Tax=Pseudoalteromonas marina TaxID=267375 RepID=UPI0023F21E59|nr:hypothetical protein [Pseudoalteromonas marina]